MSKRSFAISLFTVISSLFIILLAFFGGNQSADASGKYTEKQYITYEIQEGDSLWSIAEAMCRDKGISCKEYIEEVRSINHLSTDLITEGNKLVLVQFHQ